MIRRTLLIVTLHARCLSHYASCTFGRVEVGMCGACVLIVCICIDAYARALAFGMKIIIMPMCLYWVQ
jgi:hypothetical protein